MSDTFGTCLRERSEIRKSTKTSIHIAVWALQGVKDEAKMQPRRLELGLGCLHVARARIETEERRPKTAKTRFKMRLRRSIQEVRVRDLPGGCAYLWEDRPE